MPGSVARVVKTLIVASSLWFLGVSNMSVYALTDNGSTQIDVLLCETSSTVTLSTPVSDSIVTTPTVDVAGAVSQANQLEVYVDNVLDHIIPLTPSQTSFTGSVQLTAGTHTIKVVAIDACAGTNGSAQAVVTYQPPEEPITPPGGSTGSETPTEAGGVQIGDPLPSSDSSEDKPPAETLLPVAIMAPLLEWLNINVADIGETESLSIWRAVTIGVGMYLLTVGMATVVVQSVATLPAIQAAIPGATPGLRTKWISRGFRLLGIAIILAALFL